MKRIVLSILSLTFVSSTFAQPNCMVIGPTYQIGNYSVDSYGFTRSYTLVDDIPTLTYSNFQSINKEKSRGVGLLCDVYTKHSRIGMDLVIPLKKSPTNGFNFALAFGGYIKERIGILFGGSYYSNYKLFENAPLPTSPTSSGYSQMELTSDYKAQGDFYNNNFFAQALGANGMLNIALAETCVLSFDYGIYRSNMVTQKNDPGDNYSWDSKYSRKFEIRFALQAEGEPFGLAIKYSTWTTIGQWSGDIEYLNSSNETSTVNLNMLPERKYVLNSLMFCLMIPMGGMTSTTTTITVL